MGDPIKELAEAMAKALVDKPEAVEVAVVEGEQTTILELKVAKEDDRIKKKIEMLCGEKFIEKDEICETLSRL